MKRVRVSTTVAQERLDRARRLSGLSDSKLLDRALALLVDRLEAEREIEALKRHPYEKDPELTWEEPGPVLPYEGEVPEEVLKLARARRGGRRR